ncbi:MAG: DUF447 family protein [Hyphomicrobiaceae bacterium]|nr:DUF447 family protein [Hyphomicrobiaceae bacterium]
MPMIVETVLTTRAKSGELHIAPLGLIAEGERWVIAPFKPSRTLDNLRENPVAVANHVDDVRIIAGCLTGRKQWPVRRADKVDGAYLTAALVHWELKVEEVVEDEVRPRFSCGLVHAESHRPWSGFNRAQAAVIEAAVLVSRLHMLPVAKVDSELAYLQIAVDKTAGARELEAWGWLMEKVAAWRTTGPS